MTNDLLKADEGLHQSIDLSSDIVWLPRAATVGRLRETSGSVLVATNLGPTPSDIATPPVRQLS